jgi:hypothetical protein
MELGIVLGLILIPLQVYFGIAKMDSIIAMKNNLVEPGFDSGWRTKVYGKTRMEK